MVPRGRTAQAQTGASPVLSMRVRLLMAIALTAAFVYAVVAYYGGQQEDGAGQAGSTPEVRRDGTSIAEPTAQEALSTDRGEEPTEVQLEAGAREQAQSAALDERIRSFTIPVERALAGMEDSPLKVPMGPIPEFKETLRQFAAESDDPEWSAATETRILSEISQATGLSAGNVQVDCRTTMCRVLLTGPSSLPSPRYRSFNELVDSFGLETIWVLAIPDENGTPVNFAYVRRSGDGAAGQAE